MVRKAKQSSKNKKLSGKRISLRTILRVFFVTPTWPISKPCPLLYSGQSGAAIGDKSSYPRAHSTEAVRYRGRQTQISEALTD